MEDNNTNNQVENNGRELVRDENGRVVSGVLNPTGRPKKGHSIKETIKAMMDEKPEIKKALGQKILHMALQGDITAIKTLWNYIDGMPVQKNEFSGNDGNQIEVKIIEDKQKEDS